MSERSSKQPSSGEQPLSGSQPRTGGPASGGTASRGPSGTGAKPGSPQPTRPARLPLGARPVPQGPLPESRAWNAVSTMLSGLLGFGLPGYLADRWLGTNGVLTLLGLLLGMAGALTVIWFRYGTERS
ncbi:MAG: AtpZ/AtpI family protein [Actinomycetes bacterium]